MCIYFCSIEIVSNEFSMANNRGMLVVISTSFIVVV